jgi:hypothetical protein
MYTCKNVVFPHLSFNFKAYIVWGLMVSILPPFYPKEAEKKGATPSQVTDLFLMCVVSLR